MTPRGEILDSEDDGSDFGDGPETELVYGDERYKTISASHNIDPSVDSTDPSFFQRIYDQQNAATDTQDVIPDTAPVGHADSTWTNISSAPSPGQRLQAKDYSSLTPVTDPVPGSRKAKRAREIREAEIIDLTDITTPSKETSDVWDVPTSARSQRTYGKRNVAQLSLEQESVSNVLLDTQDPYAFPDATPPTRADRHGMPSSSAQRAQDSSPMMLVPTEMPTSSGRRTPSSRKKKDSFDTESTMPNTAVPSLYVTQSTLTASQKEQYQAIYPSSEGILPEVSETPFAGQGLEVGEMYKSSAPTIAYPTPSRVTSTIAYPTPSRAMSTRQLSEVAEEVDGAAPAGMPAGDDFAYQQSSPDILTDMTTTASSKSKRSRTKVVSSTQLDAFDLESPAPTRKTKKRKVVREAEGDSWERDPLGGTQENNDAPPQNPQTLSEVGNTGHGTAQPVADMGIPAFLPEAEPIDIEAMEVPATAPKPTAKSKRGRKKKGAKTQEPAPAPEPDEPTHAAEAEPEPVPEVVEVTKPPAKRKRGRPRKPEVSKPQPEPKNEPERQPYEEAELEAETNAAALQPLSGVDRSSQPSPEAAPVDVKGGAAGDSKENDPAVAKDAVVKDKPTEKEKQASKDVKSGPQKVQYRVGLSKRSRIAPLLKCLKKPE